MFRRSAKDDAKSKEVERQMKEEAQADALTVKLLLIGAGGSGKTTMRKQLRCVYGVGFSEEERADTAPIIIANLLDGAKAVVEASFDSTICDGLTDASSLAAANIINKLPEEHPILEPEVAESLIILWTDPVFRKTFDNRTKFQLQECWAVYMEKAMTYPKWGGPDWIPSVEDCVRARIRSSGVVEEEFEVEGATFRVMDCGGQRAERRKWIHFFEGVTAVIFVADLTAYDEVLFEDRTKNRLLESLELFEEMANNKFFSTTPFMLFLNKKDLFEQKLIKEAHPLNITGLFPDAPSEQNVEEGIKWIEDKYLERKHNIKQHPVYVHVTTAIDPQSVQYVFESCRQIMLKKALEMAGL